MAAAPPLPRTTLRVQRRFAAARQRVFEAWTKPELLVRWFTPFVGSSSDAEIDLRAGGAWRVRMQPRLWPDGYAYGTYLEVEPPQRLVFTLAWKNFPLGPETLVTVEFHDRGGSTEVVLTHDLFPGVETRNKHEHGWSGCLERLAKALA